MDHEKFVALDTFFVATSIFQDSLEITAIKVLRSDIRFDRDYGVIEHLGPYLWRRLRPGEAWSL